MQSDDQSSAFRHATGHHGLRDDRYYLFSKTSVTVMAGWPRMLAWQRSARRPAWRMVRPDCGRPSMAAPEPCQGRCAISSDDQRSEHCQRGENDCLLAHDPWRHWCALIPLEVRAAVAPFRERHWHLLSLAARCGDPAVELMQNNPALAWALASSWVFREKPVSDPMRSARRLLAPGKRQRDILAWLGFPDSEAARRQLRKLPAEQVKVNTLLSLRDALRDPDALKRLAHLPSLNWGAIRLVTDPVLRPLSSHALLIDIVTHGHLPLPDDSSDRNETIYARSAMTMQDCLRMMDVLGFHPDRLRGLRSRQELIAWHDALVARMGGTASARSLRHRAWLKLPAPPLPDTPDVQAITREIDLLREGAEQHHCVGAYGTLIAEGNVAVYRVLAPERATLAIERHAQDWQIRELRGHSNQAVGENTWRVVRDWLRQGLFSVGSFPSLEPGDTQK